MEKTVAFGRVNRRGPSPTLGPPTTFREDFKVLAKRHETYTKYDGVEWIAADIRLESTETFAQGILGYTTTEQVRKFEPEAFSWIKGEESELEGALSKTMVPFAVDLRESSRYVAFATTNLIRTKRFREGFAAVLNAAAERAGNMPTDWDVDLVTRPANVEEWVLRHPDVVSFTRIVKRHNPNISIDRDRDEMRALGARRKIETFSGIETNLAGNAVFEEKLQGLRTGELEVKLLAREGSTTIRFNSDSEYDSAVIEDYETNLELGMDRVLGTLRNYVGSLAPAQDALERWNEGES